MKTFCVKLKIQAGAYEKIAIHLVMATDETEAGKSAMLGECQDEETAEWADGALYDLGGEFCYSVKSIKEVPPEQVEVLRQYL